MKYFVTSDVHSFFTPLKKALDKNGFDINNPEHVLIICGDIFDRGLETAELFNFLNSLPENRLILIKGNHESLYLELLKKELPDSYDHHNGTVNTFCQLANVPIEQANIYHWIWVDEENAVELLKKAWADIVKKVKRHPATKLIKSKRWLDFYEVSDYIFVHGFIPLQVKDKPELAWVKKEFRPSDLPAKMTEVIPNWRTVASKKSWEEARWECPWGDYQKGFFKSEAENDKILVCGHWHTSDFFKYLDNQVVEGCPIYKNDHLIGLDACTVLTHTCNVLVIEN